jgi:hypothetical protein
MLITLLLLLMTKGRWNNISKKPYVSWQNMASNYHQKKTCIFPWKIGNRLHFICFIFHKIDSVCFHWRIMTQWKVGKRFTHRNLYVYPNPDEIMLSLSNVQKVVALATHKLCLSTKFF